MEVRGQGLRSYVYNTRACCNIVVASGFILEVARRRRRDLCGPHKLRGADATDKFTGERTRATGTALVTRSVKYNSLRGRRVMIRARNPGRVGGPKGGGITRAREGKIGQLEGAVRFFPVVPPSFAAFFSSVRIKRLFFRHTRRLKRRPPCRSSQLCRQKRTFRR